MAESSEKPATRSQSPGHPQSPSPRIAEVVIEVASPRNQQFMWPLTQVVLRGRWCRANLPGITMQPALEKMPDIPGMRVLCDPSRRIARVFDPLNEPGNQDLLSRCSRVHTECFRVAAGAEQDVELDSLDDTAVKSWLYWMRRAVDNGMAIVVHGDLPSMTTIEALPGKTRCGAFDSSARAKRYREDPAPVPF